jgi:hypothetical protein
VEPPVARNVRLADVIAASSCFPGIFEPINFPDDFRWPSAAGQTLDEVRGQLHTKLSSGVPLMDEGKLIFAVLYEMNLPHPTLYRAAPWLLMAALRGRVIYPN